MEIIKASRHYSEEEADELFPGKMLDVDAFDVLVDRTVGVDDENGEPLIRFIKGAVEPKLCATAYKNLRMAATTTDNRGLASGEVDVDIETKHEETRGVKRSKFNYQKYKLDGTLSKQSRARDVNSGIIGYFDRQRRIPYCRMTAFNLNHYPQFLNSIPFIQAVDKVFEQYAPSAHAAQQAAVNITPPEFCIANTAFTTVTVNRNFRTATHKDIGDYRDGLGVMSVLEGGAKYEGAFLCFPEYRIAVDMRTTDVCLANVHKWHGNTPIIAKKGYYERVSCVFYYREKMMMCLTPAEELRRAQLHGRSPGAFKLDESTYNTARTTIAARGHKSAEST